jgi:hypothetical protein
MTVDRIAVLYGDLALRLLGYQENEATKKRPVRAKA